ncbi:histidine phosphatase family protein [Rhodoblastus sp.]|uniref:histidine phosphatase family protein n=1 Tax=Rhodoblastus sp. TaxID=1962975 RepID=UPI002632D052|nr:histidine phosphatase family protein [Rhodoblastus sp.]
MTKILLVRHGHVEGVSPERFRGREDIPLTEKGVVQAQALAQRIKRDWRPDAIYTSPLKRCIATADAIAAATAAPVHTMENLADIDYGAWQWRTLADVGEQAPALLGMWRFAPQLVRFPDGESLQDLLARTADALRFALDHCHDQTIVFVAHDAVNRAILVQALDQPLSAYWKLAQDPGALNELEITRAHVRVIRVNDASHLSEARD